MPEPPERDGSAILTEEAELERKRLEDARASLQALLDHENKRRRNRWIFYGALAVGAILLLPFVVVYFALVIKLALSLA